MTFEILEAKIDWRRLISHSINDLLNNANFRVKGEIEARDKISAILRLYEGIFVEQMRGKKHYFYNRYYPNQVWYVRAI